MENIVEMRYTIEEECNVKAESNTSNCHFDI